MVVKILENFGKAKKTGEFYIREFDIREKGIKVLKISSYWEIEKRDIGNDRDFILVVTRGEGRVILPEKKLKIREGEIILFKKDEEFKISGNFDAIGILLQ